jgi:phenylpropionate dioxygenase-like ring-hydroxylating dioxygenase large terminal subunit
MGNIQTLERLAASPKPAPQVSLHHIPYAIDVWCPVLRSEDLLCEGARGFGPVGVALLGMPIALFRDSRGTVIALEDRCPHRGIQLSLGRVTGDQVQCAYHGWKIGRNGQPFCLGSAIACSAGMACRTYEVAEAHGLIWVFLAGNESARANAGSPPHLKPARPGSSLDLLLDMQIRAHWSLILDNGMDLFHQHLHRDIPFIFRIEALESFGSDDGVFFAHYLADFPTNVGGRQKGMISIGFQGNVATLKFGTDFVVYGIATPRSADGREVTMWWLMRRSARGFGRLVLWVLHPYLRRAIWRAFEQDRVVLESEQRALDGGFRVRVETNPVIAALHAHVQDAALRDVTNMEKSSGDRKRQVMQKVKRSWLVERACAGEVAIIRLSPPGIIDPEDLDRCLPRGDCIEVGRYGQFAVLPRSL